MDQEEGEINEIEEAPNHDNNLDIQNIELPLTETQNIPVNNKGNTQLKSANVEVGPSSTRIITCNIAQTLTWANEGRSHET